MMRLRSASRPKKSPASVLDGSSPDRRTARRTCSPLRGRRSRAGRARAPARSGTPRPLLDDVDAEVVPELALDGIRARGPDRQDRAPSSCCSPQMRWRNTRRRPVPHAVAQEEEVAVAHLVEDLQRDQALDRALRQVADVVVLGDDEVVAERPPLAPEIGGAAVELHDDRPLELAVVVDREVDVLVGHA